MHTRVVIQAHDPRGFVAFSTDFGIPLSPHNREALMAEGKVAEEYAKAKRQYPSCRISLDARDCG